MLILRLLFGLISVFGGVMVTIGTFAYGVYLLILMIDGAIAVSFGTVLGFLLCFFGAGFAGLIWGIFWAFFSKLVGCNFMYVKKTKQNRRIW